MAGQTLKQVGWITPSGSFHDDTMHTHVMHDVYFDNACKKGECEPVYVKVGEPCAEPGCLIGVPHFHDSVAW